MSKQTEALKLALEALEYISSHYMSLPKIGCMALAAVEEALAEQPAQQQEPVAYMGTDIEGNPNKFRLNPFDGGTPLYKKPQSVKVWDAEGYDALCQQLEGWKDRALKADALLREKNA